MEPISYYFEIMPQKPLKNRKIIAQQIKSNTTTLVQTLVGTLINHLLKTILIMQLEQILNVKFYAKNIESLEIQT